MCFVKQNSLGICHTMQLWVPAKQSPRFTPCTLAHCRLGKYDAAACVPHRNCRSELFSLHCILTVELPGELLSLYAAHGHVYATESDGELLSLICILTVVSHARWICTHGGCMLCTFSHSNLSVWGAWTQRAISIQSVEYLFG